MVYLVSYDLVSNRNRSVIRVTKPRGAAVHPFFQELENSRSWWHYLDNTWLISTDETLKELDRRLRQHLDPTDKLLMVKLHGEYAGTLPEEAWEWIEDRIAEGELVK